MPRSFPGVELLGAQGNQSGAAAALTSSLARDGALWRASP
jgi:hypothetical protein